MSAIQPDQATAAGSPAHDGPSVATRRRSTERSSATRRVARNSCSAIVTLGHEHDLRLDRTEDPPWWIATFAVANARCHGDRRDHLPDHHRRRRVGSEQPDGWGWAIVNFVWWVGIGHAGTLISAILCLFKQKWRVDQPLRRSDDDLRGYLRVRSRASTSARVDGVDAVPDPELKPDLPNFRSPLLWDVFAVSTYFTVSLLFWYMGMIPDLATLRDRCMARIKQPVTIGLMWAPHPLPGFVKKATTVTLP